MPPSPPTASIAIFASDDQKRRPKVDVHHFSLLEKLREVSLGPDDYDYHEARGTDAANFAIHNYEDRSAREIIAAEDMFLAHFPETTPHPSRRARPRRRAGAR